MTDPFTVLLCDENGHLRDDVLYHYVAKDSVPAALKNGWMPIGPGSSYVHEEWGIGIVMAWICCPCGRKLELP